MMKTRTPFLTPLLLSLFAALPLSRSIHAETPPAAWIDAPARVHAGEPYELHASFLVGPPGARGEGASYFIELYKDGALVSGGAHTVCDDIQLRISEYSVASAAGSINYKARLQGGGISRQLDHVITVLPAGGASLSSGAGGDSGLADGARAERYSVAAASLAAGAESAPASAPAASATGDSYHDPIVPEGISSASDAPSTAVAAVVAPPGTPPVSRQTANRSYRRGINIAGAEYGNRSVPGNLGVENTNYTWNDEAVYRYFAGKGFDIFRVPFRWDRMQPVLNGPLDPQYLAGLKRNIEWAKQYGGQVILDVHSFAAYYGVRFDTPDASNPDLPVPTSAHFNDFWTKLSNEFKDEPGVYAYDLMNEPVGISESAWKNISQSCLLAIRKNGDSKLIMIEGSAYAGASDWANKNKAAAGGWISDPANNYMYSAHCYFDQDASGTYSRSFDGELGGDIDAVTERALKRIRDFIDWCDTFEERGFVGEFGVPASEHPPSSSNHHPDDRWLQVLEAFMTALDAAGMDATYWQGSIWSRTNSDPLSALPENYGPENETIVDTPQMAVLARHLSHTAPGALPSSNNENASASSANGGGGGGAPGWWSLVALAMLVALRAGKARP
ncbi:MAG: glycoside hydrolase family 5 protein [Opitutaceae bacterium]|jgi:endoglucanase|nr:glycoside hydrolase family 5 protein [Opitutaceae bacterium]